MRKPIWIAVALLCVVVLIGAWIIVRAANDPAAPNNVVWDTVPAVMVDETLYIHTGHESKRPEIYDVVDGEITSKVPGNETPTQNDQSNFGVGYIYRYGPVDGTLEVLIGDEWCIYATAEMRDRMHTQSTRYALLFAANTSLQQEIILTEAKPYWCITVENEGPEAIKVEIAGVIYEVEAGASALLSTETKQEPGTYTISFSTAAPSGLDGRVTCEVSAIPWETQGAVILQDQPT